MRAPAAWTALILAASVWLPSCASEPEVTPATPVPGPSLAELQETIAARESEVAALKRGLAEAERRERGLQANLQAIQTQLTEARRKQLEGRREVSRLRAEEAKLRARLAPLEKAQERVAAVDRNLANLRSQFAAVKLEHQAETARQEKLIRQLRDKLKDRK